ncbi:hypothetical protein V1520DRAFT_378929 [Lipomyces starkeyi]|uniref:Replication origin-binding protein domain-containing protein n=1 Tax=Lipomyces starkeyi NRRL Y-11557 TaxID=675824 RepID=A0A1E3QCQ5_LIPST|nr:hypothetical protein LIPSTDRAFT_816 [Lipomyces starkeyi NRRL Y-11557]
MRSVHRAQLEIYGNGANQPDHTSADARVFRQVDDDDQVAEPAAEAPVHAGYNMIDDDEVIVLDSGAKILCRDLTDGSCTVLCARQTWTKNAGRVGHRQRDWHGYCRLYQKSDRPNGHLLFQLYVPDSPDLVCGSINWQGREDISFDGDYRLFLLDALGRGKTHCVRGYLRANPRLSISSITFRQSLARYLSSELGLACYLDNGFWAPEARVRSRCVVCRDSIVKLRSEAEAYDLIVIDECVFVKYHFLAGTITNSLPDVMRTFQRLLQDSGRVICMQHRIPETTIAFYMRGIDIDAESAGTIRRKINAPVVLPQMKVLTSRSSGGR